MMSPDGRALEDLLYSSDLGDEAEGAEPGGSPPGLQESAAADTVSMMSSTASPSWSAAPLNPVNTVGGSGGHLYSCLLADCVLIGRMCCSVCLYPCEINLSLCVRL